ncbi:MAG: metalloregulator ArsR/SmtB family transcription factor [Bacilli bacterium]|nr:metalloregulator ArsR/SmtB family transcription factor [Bacilli bacterium]
MKKDVKELTRIFDVLSNEVRLCILLKLMNEEEKNVTYLQQCTNVSQSMVSQQLAKLKAQGIITCKKQGNEVHYRIKDNKIKDMLKMFV